MKRILSIPIHFALRNKNIILEIICYLLIILFVYAASSKLLDYEKFRVQVGQSPILTSIGGWIAWMVLAVEFGIAIMLAIPRLRLVALYASFSLMVIFTTYIIMILKFSPFVPCSCGGILEKMGWTEHLYFNIGFVLLALIGVLLYNSGKLKTNENEVMSNTAIVLNDK